LGAILPSSKWLKTEKQISTHSSLQSNSFENKTTQLNETSTHYSSTPLIFRKPSLTTNSSFHKPAPSKWSSVEELVSGSGGAESSNVFTPLNFSGAGFAHQNSAASTKSESPKPFANHQIQRQSLANGGITAPDTFTPAQPITETIERPSAQPTDANSSDLERLAREIYHRLRQRLELERERHGISSGRLPW